MGSIRALPLVGLISSAPPADRTRVETDAFRALRPETAPPLDSAFETGL
ncbi:MAG: hypothetical protein LBE67_08985 [Kocuria palustris]|nr:hypothetical protein [Kocuria palustris]